MTENNRPKPVPMPDGQYDAVPNTEKKGLTAENSLLNVFTRQIDDKAWELQYGELTVTFKVRAGAIKEAHIIEKKEKLQPF